MRITLSADLYLFTMNRRRQQQESAQMSPLLAIYALDCYVYAAYNVCMQKIQYTIRNIPPQVDKAIRKRATRSGKSFNQTVVDLLSLQVLGSTEPSADNNFDWLFDKKSLDNDFDEAVEKLSQVDEKLWR